MFTATYIEYNGIHSATYGLKLGSFDGDSQEENAIFSPKITTAKPKNIKRLTITNIEEDSAPEAEMTLVSNVPIHDDLKRQILAWLNSGHEFKKLKIDNPNAEDCYYLCRFRDIKDIKISGQCVGFTMTAVFDSPYQYGATTKVSLETGEYENKIINIYNKSDIIDDYIYPIITFTPSDSGSITIVNKTDDTDRKFEFKGLSKDVTVTIDNELKVIDGDGALLENFNKNWLRLVKGKNVLEITFNGSFKIECPQLVAIGF